MCTYLVKESTVFFSRNADILFQRKQLSLSQNFLYSKMSLLCLSEKRKTNLVTKLYNRILYVPVLYCIICYLYLKSCFSALLLSLLFMVNYFSSLKLGVVSLSGRDEVSLLSKNGDSFSVYKVNQKKSCLVICVLYFSYKP